LYNADSGVILFFDDEPRMCRRYQQALLQQGYTVKTPQSVQQALEIFEQEQVVLIVHGYHGCQKTASLCESVSGRFPFLPSIHITVKKSFAPHRLGKGPQHVVMRPLTPDRKFLKKVNELISWRQLLAQERVLKKAWQENETFEAGFDRVEQDKYPSVILNYLAEKLNASNVIWLKAGDIEYVAQNISNFTAAEGDSIASISGAPEQVSLWDCTAQEWLGILQDVISRLPMGWALNENPQLFKDGETTFGLVPVFDLKEQKGLGHFLVQQPKRWDSAMEEMADIVRAISRKMTLSREYQETKGLSYIDDVTGLYNQRYLHEVLDKEIGRCQRAKDVFSILFIDIDHFKRVNDSNGHLVGSKLLVALSKVLKRNIRSTDYGFRYGGDEYLLLTVGTPAEKAREVGERIRREVQDTVFDVDGVKVKLTISVGIASYPKHARTKEDVVRLADEAMYYGKNKSRNVVYVAS
jgi:diguanylate cyclase (GGDEF)-like protein